MRGAPAEPESSDPPAPTYTKSYTYDLAGNRTGFTLTQGSEAIQELNYTYDTLNRLSSVSMDNVTQASYTYDTNGNRASLSYPNGVTETYTYNLANWVTGLTNSDGVDTLSSFAYTYYASGNRMSETDLSGKTISYIYDGLGRLTQESETSGKTVAYSYDAAGNRAQMTVTGTEAYTTAYTYDANNRLLSEAKVQDGETISTSYTYDADGNTLSKTVSNGSDPAEVTAYSYNCFNQLLSVTAGSCPVYYSYNASGIRTAKLTNGVQTSFLLDGGDVVAEAQNDVLYASYLRGVNLICRESNSAAEYYLFDAHADVVALTDETGAVTKSYEYDAFGCEASPDPLDCNPFRYCGEYYDVETGSYYLRARYYAPTIGRFTQQDTHWTTANMIYGDNPQKINEKQDALGLKNYTYVPQITAVLQAGNQYVYGINNPLLFIDPFGFRIVVFCYNNPSSGFEDQVKNSAYFDVNSDDVEIIYVMSAQDFIDAWNAMDDSSIDDIYLYLHGGEGKLYFKGESLSFNGELSFSDLNNKKVNRMVYLFSCHGGKGDTTSNVAWMFANKTGAIVRATDSSVSYSQIFGKYHARVDKKSFLNLFSHFWGNYYYGKQYIFWGGLCRNSHPMIQNGQYRRTGGYACEEEKDKIVFADYNNSRYRCFVNGYCY